MAEITRALGPEYDVVPVTDGAAALALAQEQQWDLVLADVALPKLNGFALLGELRAGERTRTLPVMLLSARTDEDGSAVAMAAGAVDHVTIPFSANALRARVAARLENARVMRDAAATARDSERRMRLAMDAANMFSWEVDLLSGRTSVSGNVAQVVGFSRDSASAGVQETVGELVHPDDRARLLAAIEEARHSGSYHGEVRLIDPVSGQCVWVEAHGTVVRDADGRPAMLIGVTQNIAARKQFEAAIERGREQLQLVSDNVPALISYVDAERRYQWCNHAYTQWFGTPVSSIVGRAMREVVGEAAWQTIGPNIDAALGGQRVEYEAEAKYRTGGPRWIHAVYTPHRDGDGAVIGVVVMVYDITERKHIEEALQANDRSKDEFLAMLAHELRNPLAPIRHAAEVLKVTAPGDPSQSLARGVIERQTQHLTRLVEDLLDVSRITRGTITLRPERLAVAAVVERAVEAIRPAAEARGQTLTVNLPPSTLEVEGDLIRLVQVLSNVLSNASKFSDDGGPIAVTAAQDGSHAVIRVRDNGIGIPRELVPRVFDLFTQGDRSLDRSRGGLGIGLTLARLLVDRHHGTIEARSDGPGSGSEFVVRLPLAGATAIAPDPPIKSAVAAAPVRSAKRVLIVEDHADAAEMLRMLLTLQGYEVEVAGDGAAALEAARRLQPRAIVCDIGLPHMSGYELAQQLRALTPNAPSTLIALSGYGQDEDRRRAIEAGFDHHLVKPVEPQALFSLLDSLSD